MDIFLQAWVLRTQADLWLACISLSRLASDWLWMSSCQLRSCSIHIFFKDCEHIYNCYLEVLVWGFSYITFLRVCFSRVTGFWLLAVTDGVFYAGI